MKECCLCHLHDLSQVFPSHREHRLDVPFIPQNFFTASREMWNLIQTLCRDGQTLLNLPCQPLQPIFFLLCSSPDSFLEVFESNLVPASGTLRDLLIHFVQDLRAIVSSKWSCPTCVVKIISLLLGILSSITSHPSPVCKQPHYSSKPLSTTYITLHIQLLTFGFLCWNICCGSVVTYLSCSMLCLWVSAYSTLSVNIFG